MELTDAVVVVTGGGGGIGRAMCLRFAAEGARAVVAADIDAAAAAETVRLVEDDSGSAGLAVRTDVSDGADVDRLVAEVVDRFGPVDLFVGNAGIGTDGGVDAPPEQWDRAWAVNVMAHVHAARAVLPSMIARGEGYLLLTASAAGLLTALGAAPYAVTKSAVIALAEWLAITHGDDGIKVSCLCPQGVRTGMLDQMIDRGDLFAGATLAGGDPLEPADVADAVIAGLAAERFLILPHPEVADYVRRKAEDPDRWLSGMRRLQRRLGAVAVAGANGDRLSGPDGREGARRTKP